MRIASRGLLTGSEIFESRPEFMHVPTDPQGLPLVANIVEFLFSEITHSFLLGNRTLTGVDAWTAGLKTAVGIFTRIQGCSLKHFR